MENNKETNILTGIILGTLATVGITTATYFLCKTDTAKLIQRKYFNWKEELNDE